MDCHRSCVSPRSPGISLAHLFPYPNVFLYSFKTALLLHELGVQRLQHIPSPEVSRNICDYLFVFLPCPLLTDRATSLAVKKLSASSHARLHHIVTQW